MKKTNKMKTDEKNAQRINFGCCKHINGKERYYLGYTGLKCCAVAICQDCEERQFVGGFFAKLIYPIVRMFSRDRVEILKTVHITPIDWDKMLIEIERFGRDRQ